MVTAVAVAAAELAQAFVLLPVLAAGRQLAVSTVRGPRTSTEQESS